MKQASIRGLSEATIEANKKQQGYSYIRVSDESEIEETSLFTQTKAIIKYASDNNVKLVDILSNPGKSGLKINNRR